MGPVSRALFAVVAILWSCASIAHADDHVLTHASIELRRTAAHAKIAFGSEDPALLVPAVGSPDDPATGNPGLIELFSATEGAESS